MNILIQLLIVLLSRGQILSPILFGGNQASGGSTPFITTQTLGSTRSNLTGCVGFAFTVGASNITVTDMGRWVFPGNSATHLITIQDFSGASIVSGTVNTSGATSGQYLYVSVGPATLTAGNQYFIGSNEVNGGDVWGDDTTTVTPTSDATINYSAFIASTCPSSGVSSNTLGNFSYVPPNFKYHL